MPQPIEISIIAPAFNELGNVTPLIERIRDIFTPLNIPFEAVIVDDASTDGTREKLLDLAAQYPWLRVIRLDKNSGQSAAMDAGFRHARGLYFGTVDADMQNDPGEIPRLLDILKKENVDMVNGWRKDRKDKNKFLRRFQSKIANGIRSSIIGDGINDSACGLKVYKRECLANIPRFKGMHRFFPALVKMQGYTVIEVPVSHNPRFAGVTKYKFGSRVFKALADLFAVRWMKKRLIQYQASDITPLNQPH